MKVRLSKPQIGPEEIEAVTRVLQTDQLSLGPVTKAFENEFAEKLQTRFAIAVNSGTSGLHLAVRAAGIKEGNEVITTPFSFVASANCILFEKATPVFVDIEEDSFGIDPELLDSALTDRSRGVIPVHVFGQACQIDSVMDFANRHDLHVIEDACESPLAMRNGTMTGNFGHSAVYGFYPNKQMTTGEGGMITTNDEKLADQFRSLRNQGRATDLQWLSHYQLGYNYRISEMTAAVGLEQTKKLPGFISARQKKADFYNYLLSDVEEIKVPNTLPGNNHTWFVYAVRVESGSRDTVLKMLNEKGIQSKAYFSPCIHLQEFYKTQYGYREGMFPVAEKISKEVVILPFFNQISEEQMEYVAASLKEIITSLKNARVQR